VPVPDAVFIKKENRNGGTFKYRCWGIQIDADLNASWNIAAFSDLIVAGCLSTSQL
jgi:transposase